jgi:hypothetical protein
LQDEAKSNVFLNELKEKDNYETIKDALNPQDYNMIVTPKEIEAAYLDSIANEPVYNFLFLKQYTYME